jgi:hypothetical protein
MAESDIKIYLFRLMVLIREINHCKVAKRTLNPKIVTSFKYDYFTHFSLIVINRNPLCFHKRPIIHSTIERSM